MVILVSTQVRTRSPLPNTSSALRDRNCHHAVFKHSSLSTPLSLYLPLQQTFPSQLHLAGGFASLEATPGHTNALSVCELKFILVTGPWAGTVMWEVYTGEGVGTQIIRAVSCAGYRISNLSSTKSLILDPLRMPYICPLVIDRRRNRMGRFAVGGVAVRRRRRRRQTFVRRC